MFKHRQRQSRFTAALVIAELVYHSMVRTIRNAHGNAVISLAINLMQIAIMVAAFYILFTVLSLRGAILRGDFLLYIMSGIFLYMTHIRALGAVTGAEGPSSAMMKHAPMSTFISILSGALGALYIQVLSLALILFGYYVAVTPFEVQYPAAAFGMLVLAWFSGVSIGLVLLAAKPWFPVFVTLFSTVYQRANMIASGKMFVANMLPPKMLAMFDWNPLFHCIDQSRGFTFINYTPRNSDWTYTFKIAIVLIVVGMMAEFYTRRNMSLSWTAGK